jgi:hypothetical protein
VVFRLGRNRRGFKRQGLNGDEDTFGPCTQPARPVEDGEEGYQVRRQILAAQYPIIRSVSVCLWAK